jgi:hypothetical protein
MDESIESYDFELSEKISLDKDTRMRIILEW